MDAASGAEVMLDGLVAEGVGGEGAFGRQQPELVARDEPVQRAHARADRAIAIRDLGEFALDFKGDLPAVTAAFVVHCVAPFMSGLVIAAMFVANGARVTSNA